MTPRARKALSGEQAFAPLVAAYGPCPVAATNVRPYQALLRAIVYQQLSGKAAGTILSRVLALYPGGRFPNPERVLDTPDDDLRAAGLSRAKTAAIKDLAAKTRDRVVPTAGQAQKLDDEELIERLIAVRGVGRWTAQMFLISALGRPDVWPVDDLGVRNGWATAHGLDEPPSAKDMDALGACLRPFRTSAAWYLWQAADKGKPPDL